MGGWPVGFYKEWRSWIRDHWSTNPSSGREEDYQSSALPLGHARLPPSTTCDVIDLNVTRYSWYAFSTARVDPRTANNPGPQTISKLKTGLKFNLVRWFSAPYVVNLFSFVYTDRQTDRQPAFRRSYSGGLSRHSEQKKTCYRRSHNWQFTSCVRVYQISVLLTSEYDIRKYSCLKWLPIHDLTDITWLHLRQFDLCDFNSYYHF